MRKLTMVAALAAASLLSAAALAAEPARPAEASAPEMTPLKVGAEQKALKSAFGKFPATRGHIAAGMMGQTSPEVPTSMRSSCKDVLGGLFLACDIDDTMNLGKTKTTWKGHMLAGWDTTAKMYKGVLTDNFGDFWNFDGKLDGKKLTWETPHEVTMMGQTFKERLTFDMTDPRNATFTEEHKAATGDWTVFESSSQKGDAKSAR